MASSSMLLDVVRRPSDRKIPEGLLRVGRMLNEKFQPASLGILLYGSCLRAKSDQESLVDCYVLVDRYSAAYQSKLLALANWVLPPNVFYAEVPFSDRIIRVKYAVLSLSDLERSVKSCWFHSYFWARFAQPTVLLEEASQEVQQRVFQAFAHAVTSFLGNSLPLMEQVFTAEQLWQTGLKRSYGAELRSEPEGRGQHLWAHDREYYEQATLALLGQQLFMTHVESEDGMVRYRAQVSRGKRWWCHAAWVIRTMQGKGLSVLRLIKAAFTFAGGIDYLIWKIERHSGVKIELTPAQRRHPILTGLTTFWRLYRQGAFR